MKTVAILNQKGGVGKTTTTANLAYALTQKGYKVLTIDFDSQASLTNYLNIGLRKNELYEGITEVMYARTYPSEVDYSLQDIIERSIKHPTYQQFSIKLPKDNPFEEIPFGFDLIPSHISLADYELLLQQYKKNDSGIQLYTVVQIIKEKYDYDFTLIDCPPALGIMAMNAIGAATDGVLIPTNLDIMSLRGVENLIEQIANIQELLKGNLDITHKGVLGILMNEYSTVRRIDRNLAINMEEFYPIYAFKTTIPESTKAKEAVNAGLTYCQTYGKAKDAYLKLANEFIDVVNNKQFEIKRMERKLDI